MKLLVVHAHLRQQRIYRSAYTNPVVAGLGNGITR